MVRYVNINLYTCSADGIYIYIFFSFFLLSVARRSNEYAALQSALLTRKLPDEILFLSWSFMATVELCG